ncbi:host cell division inhibitor Icd-like protein [Pantoea agglomerans]|uniref:host cell division inhibitor Icd-like protein n=2 Tax=Enterobacter agglomerans TaxID=549 RepID=UPI002ED485E8|nr:host cell division inhibitor Icd-like protein [Pantoea agglomerans]
MPAMRSCAIRAVTDCDLAFFGPVAIHLSYNSWCKTIYTDLFLLKGLTCKTPDCYCLSYTLGVLKVDLAKPGSVTSTYRASNHNVTRTYTMAYSHSTQTHPEKHLWRFLALDRADMNAIPRRVSVEAPTEHDARLVLAPYFILSLAARLPAQGVCNV